METCKKNYSILSRIKKSIKTKKNVVEFINKKVVLVGNPNVGKSVIFNDLTGSYVTVSNYPGTTVEINKGNFLFDNYKAEIIDTPGMYSMVSITDEERVTRNILMEDRPDLVVHVIDAKNIKRMLPLTIQLIEAGFNLVLVLNIMDEAKDLGMKIDTKKLEEILKIKIIETSAALNKGLKDVLKSIKEHLAYVA
ncbi:MAG: FeoB small GTPase domain-containing protein [Clostridiales bacterium]